MTLVPPSIRLFRIVYGVVLVLSLLNVALIWPSLSRIVATNPALGGAGPALQIGVVATGLAVPLLVWWFAGFRRSRIARMALVVLVAVAVVSMLRTILGGQIASDALGLVQLAALSLQVIALVLLFRPDAKLWFARRSGPLL